MRQCNQKQLNYYGQFPSSEILFQFAENAVDLQAREILRGWGPLLRGEIIFSKEYRNNKIQEKPQRILIFSVFNNKSAIKSELYRHRKPGLLSYDR